MQFTHFRSPLFRWESPSSGRAYEVLFDEDGEVVDAAVSESARDEPGADEVNSAAE
jgi:hypothetical protein